MNILEYKKLITDYSRDLIMSEGYKKITIELIASNLSISKKSIYKVFSSKRELIASIFLNELNNAYNGIIHLIQEKSTMIEKVEKLSNLIENYIRIFNELSLNNLKREYPQIWKEIILFRKERVLPLINNLLNHSKKHDIIKDYSNELIIRLFSSALTISTERNYLLQNSYDYKVVFNSIFEILLNGIFTKKGKKLLAINKRMKNENN
ncbi:MAG: TetR/AcrR family transcriptional regulator [Melioribacteraceae bacterium]|nr:TetR/AcrR family transcriptional regulator [Melioribacteraceae bacterium]